MEIAIRTMAPKIFDSFVLPQKSRNPGSYRGQREKLDPDDIRMQRTFGL